MLFSVFSAFARVFWCNPGRRALLKCHKTGPQLFQNFENALAPRICLKMRTQTPPPKHSAALFRRGCIFLWFFVYSKLPRPPPKKSTGPNVWKRVWGVLRFDRLLEMCTRGHPFGACPCARSARPASYYVPAPQAVCTIPTATGAPAGIVVEHFRHEKPSLGGAPFRVPRWE